MKLYIQRDKGKAICQDCRLVDATFDYRNLEIKKIENLLKISLLRSVADVGAQLAHLRNQRQR